MKTTNEFLDAVKVRHGLESDYALAKALGVGTSVIGNYRVGRSHLNNTMAAKVAELLALDPLEVIAAAEIERAERAKDEKAKGFWMRYAAALLMVVGVSAPPSPAEASTAQPVQQSVLCQIKGRRKKKTSKAAGTFQATVRQLLRGPRLALF